MVNNLLLRLLMSRAGFPKVTKAPNVVPRPITDMRAGIPDKSPEPGYVKINPVKGPKRIK